MKNERKRYSFVVRALHEQSHMRSLDPSKETCVGYLRRGEFAFSLGTSLGVGYIHSDKKVCCGGDFRYRISPPVSRYAYVHALVCDLLYLTFLTFGRTLLQSPVWNDPYVGTPRVCGKNILVLSGDVLLCALFAFADSFLPSIVRRRCRT